MKKTGFTLVEILAAIIILSILTSLSIVAYQKTLETNDERICQQQQKILQGAIEAYTIENDSLPNELAQLKPDHIHLAYLKVAGQRPEGPGLASNSQSQRNKLLALWQDFLGTRPAIAQTPVELGKYYNYDTRILRCPDDKTVSSDPKYTSYKINTYDFIDTADLKDTVKANTALIYDKDAYHKKAFSLSGEKYQVSIGPTGLYGKKNNNPNTVDSGAVSNIDAPVSSLRDAPTVLGSNTGTTVDNVAQETHSLSSTTCSDCCLTRDNWRALTKTAKKACKEADFRHQKKDESYTGKCFNFKTSGNCS